MQLSLRKSTSKLIMQKRYGTSWRIGICGGFKAYLWINIICTIPTISKQNSRIAVFPSLGIAGTYSQHWYENSRIATQCHYMTDVCVYRNIQSAITKTNYTQFWMAWKFTVNAMKSKLPVHYLSINSTEIE